jgi:hypothetical protein
MRVLYTGGPAFRAGIVVAHSEPVSDAPTAEGMSAIQTVAPQFLSKKRLHEKDARERILINIEAYYTLDFLT